MRDVNDWIERYVGPWWLLALLGLSNVVLGVLALVWPGRTVVVLVVLLGIHLLIYGTIRFVWAVADAEMTQRGFVALMGVLGILAGLVVLRRPFRTLAVLVVFLGLYWVFSGLVDLFNAATDRTLDHRALLAGLGVLSVGAGAVVLFWPGVSLLAMAVIAGVHLVIAGVVELALALRLRKVESVEMAAAGAAPA